MASISTSGIIVELERAPSTPSPTCDRLDWPATIEEVDALDLSFWNSDWAESMIRDGMRAVVRATESPELKTKEIDAWVYLSKYTPDVGRGFMFSDDPIVLAVGRHMEIGHSGSSYAGTMREIEVIAKNGFAKYRGYAV